MASRGCHRLVHFVYGTLAGNTELTCLCSNTFRSSGLKYVPTSANANNLLCLYVCRARLVQVLVLEIKLYALQIGEVVGGLFAHSLAVLTDAAHMLSDVLAFIISLCAGTYALRASKASHTFGYHRAEVLGSMVILAFP